ncbi:MAG TPA: hypothetical protein VF434_07755, partial [Promineifilum sp.]
MASIVEWQSIKMQEYRYSLLERIALVTARVFAVFGVNRPLRYEPVPVVAGDYDHALHVDHPEAPSILEPYLNRQSNSKAATEADTTPVPDDLAVEDKLEAGE